MGRKGGQWNRSEVECKKRDYCLTLSYCGAVKKRFSLDALVQSIDPALSLLDQYVYTTRLVHIRIVPTPEVWHKQSLLFAISKSLKCIFKW